ncbi:hypothetical protein LXL04_008829 [Taraxacum kok-saghyz]
MGYDGRLKSTLKRLHLKLLLALLSNINQTTTPIEQKSEPSIDSIVPVNLHSAISLPETLYSVITLRESSTISTGSPSCTRISAIALTINFGGISMPTNEAQAEKPRFTAQSIYCKKQKTCTELRYFENSYIPENPRTPPISYISQTVIPFKKPTSGLFKTYLSVFETKS